MVKEANSMDQAYKTLPKDEFLCEDHDNVSFMLSRVIFFAKLTDLSLQKYQDKLDTVSNLFPRLPLKNY